jgi:hypothetical protein
MTRNMLARDTEEGIDVFLPNRGYGRTAKPTVNPAEPSKDSGKLNTRTKCWGERDAGESPTPPRGFKAISAACDPLSDLEIPGTPQVALAKAGILFYLPAPMSRTNPDRRRFRLR